MKKIGILGSTGSIGTQTLEVVRANKDLQVVALAAGSSVDAMEKQIREFCPKIACLWQEERANELREKVKDLPVKVVAGMEGLQEIAVLPGMEILVTAVVGMIGIRPTIAAIEAGKDIALANKETLVTAGHLIMPLARKKGVRILPVDSEHSAIFQCLHGEDGREVEKLLITASGGPFRGRTAKELCGVTVEDALKHPNWSMGKKITVDSATLVNKGLEVIEARWLFDIDFDSIEVVVQPQSIIHSMVQFRDGAVMAQLGSPDMRLPIQYALYYPKRLFLNDERLDFAKLSQITFEAPNCDVFRGLPLAYEAGRAGGTMPTALNAANEKAVALFLERKIDFLTIWDIIEYCMREHTFVEEPKLSQILNTEQEVYDIIESRW